MSLSLRCSALPLAFICAGSVRPGELRVDETNPQGALGSAAHEGLEALPRLGRIDWAAVGELAQRHQVDEDELRVLLAQGQKLWNESLRGSFPDAETEAYFLIELPGGSTLSGHADLLARSYRTVHVGDWKTGRLDLDYSEQLRGYCALALLDDTELESATATVIWLREGEAEGYTMRRDELPAYLRRVKDELIDWDGTFRAGSHCRHCPRSHECPARHALVRRDVAAFLGGDLGDYGTGDALAALAPEKVVALLATSDLVHEITERTRRAIRELVEKNGDIVADGKRLTIERSERRHLKVVEALDVLEEQGFTMEERVETMQLHVSQAEKIIAKKAPYRGGKKAIDKLRAELAKAGAIYTEPVTKLVTKRA